MRSGSVLPTTSTEFDLTHLNRAGGEPLCRLADQYPRAVGLAGAFETGREVHGVSDHRVAAGLLRADIADHDFAGRDADSDVDLRQAAPHAYEIGQLGLEFRQGGELFQRGGTGEAGLVLGGGERRAPERHDRVADIFVDDPVVAAYRVGDHRKVAVQHVDEADRRHALAEAGKALHVAEQDRHLAPRALRIGQLRPVDQPRDDTRIDVLAERLADLRLDPQLADHRVERMGETADLVARGDRDHGVEGAILDRGGAGQQPANRFNEADSNRGGKRDPQQCCEQQQRQPDIDDAHLVGAGALDCVRGDAAHLGSRGSHPMVPIVAPLVETDAHAIRFRAIPGLRSGDPFRENAFVTLLRVLQELDMRVEPCKRHVVVEVERVLDLFVDGYPSRRQLLAAAAAGGGDAFAQRPEVLLVLRFAIEQGRGEAA